MKQQLLDNLRALIQGQEVEHVSPDNSTLTLKDGTTLKLYESDSDCCASASGKWELKQLDTPDLHAGITDITFDVVEGEASEFGDEYVTAEITLLHNQHPVAVAECYADNGNGGYYFSQLSLTVQVPTLGVKVDGMVLEC